MCGVAGVIDFRCQLSSKDQDDVLGMGKLLRHRGPSQQGHYFHPSFALANTRLAILDPSSSASLPMIDEEAGLFLCFNGEISNFQELKRQFGLEKKYQFKSHSDTEVLLRLYQEIGISCLQYLSGMFAFCIVDLNAQKAYVVRDFYGINPLFYSIQGSKIYFASEMKAFFAVDDIKKTVNDEALYHYFGLGYIPNKLTPYKELIEFQGSEYLDIDLARGTFEHKKYYELEYVQNHDLTEKVAAEKTYDLLLDSVRRNLLSDAPVGMTLSGGVDTSVILSLVKELGKSKGMNTYALKMGQSSFDESHYQRFMSEYAQTQHHEILVTPEMVEKYLVEHMAYVEEPLVNGASIPSYILAQEASKDVKVLLSGEGGDEVFNAYETHGAFKWRKLYRSVAPSALRQAVRWSAHQLPVSCDKLSLEFKLKRFTTGSEFDVPESHFYWRHVFTEEQRKALLTHSDFNKTASWFSDLFYDSKFDHELNKISLIDIKYFFIADLMVKNDRTFLSHSVEGRFPFMDRLLVDFVRTIPADMRMKGFKRRYIEKLAMKGVLPEKIRQRTNFGLEMPHAHWLKKDLKLFAEKYFTKKEVEKSGYLYWSQVERLWKEHLGNKQDHGRALWSILMFMIWFDLYVYHGNFRQYLRQT